ncbi:MAG TPA: hypothetical protein VKV38_11820 [Trebonia sp.]|jgi:hypothetical protein|nr:hypothetical protein [Trebonia sp.]
MGGTGDFPACRRTLLGNSGRDRFVAAGREHHAAGRLSLDELRRPAEIVLAAAYRDEAEGALAGLPMTAPGDAAAGRRAGQGPRRGRLSRRGHAEAARPAPGWTATPERFRDPSSGVIMRVWVDPADGSRHYVPDDASGAG